MIDLPYTEKPCCDNDLLNRSSRCHTNHTLEQMIVLVSAYRDRVPEAAKVAGAYCVRLLDDLTRSDVPESAKVLGEYNDIIRGRRELLDAGIRMHATCVVKAAYHAVERALLKATASEEYDPRSYMCANHPVPGAFRRRHPELVASVFDRGGQPSGVADEAARVQADVSTGGEDRRLSALEGDPSGAGSDGAADDQQPDVDHGDVADPAG